MAIGFPDRTPSERELRWFGLLLLAVFAVFGGVAWWRFEAPAAARILVGVGLGLAVIHAAVRSLRRPLYDLWMRLTWPLGWAVSHLVLAVIFYGIIAPMGIAMRIFGRDRLTRRFDAAAESYWVAHDPGGEPARYLRQS